MDRLQGLGDQHVEIAGRAELALHPAQVDGDHRLDIVIDQIAIGTDDGAEPAQRHAELMDSLVILGREHRLFIGAELVEAVVDDGDETLLGRHIRRQRDRRGLMRHRVQAFGQGVAAAGLGLGAEPDREVLGKL